MVSSSKPQVGGLVHNDHLAMIGVMDVPSGLDVSGRLLSALSDEGINVELVVHLADLEGNDHIILGIDRHDLDGALRVVERMRREIGDRSLSGLEGMAVTSDPEVALVSLFGLDLREQRGVASQMCKALQGHGIKICAISTSLSTISCLIEARRLDEAVQSLREVFVLP